MRKRQQAFTIIELLTVIAIIAILTGIIVPVYSRAKDNANRSSDMADMNSIRVALGLYREDQGAYPPQLLGYVSLYASGPNIGNVIPAHEIKGYIYPARLQSLASMTPIHDKFSPTATTKAVFPQQDPVAVGQAALLDLNGDGAVTPADDILGARQVYGPGDGDVCWSTVLNGVIANCGATPTLDFYAVSGYDVTETKTPTGVRTELRYARFWSGFAVGQGAGLGNGSEFDDPRQLGYSNPPDDTVVTWNTYYREFTSPGVPSPIRKDIILYLGGSARPFDSKAASDYSWRQRP